MAVEPRRSKEVTSKADVVEKISANNGNERRGSLEEEYDAMRCAQSSRVACGRECIARFVACELQLQVSAHKNPTTLPKNPPLRRALGLKYASIGSLNLFRLLNCHYCAFGC